jgi:hypothetical protein
MIKEMSLATSLVALLAALPAAAGEGGGSSYQRDVEPLLVTYCYDCHGEGSARGGVTFDEYPSAEARRGDGALWWRVWENVRNGTMPPRGQPRPDDAARARLVAWIRQDVQGVDCRAPDPGRVTIRRLNRDEYNASVADLFGIDDRPGDDLPADDSGYGFDNIGEVLSVSPLLTEKYFAAAERIVRRVVALEPEIPRRVIGTGEWRTVAAPGPELSAREASFSLEHGGPHRVAVTISVALGDGKGPPAQPRVRFEVDGRPVVRATYGAVNHTYRYTAQLPLAAGQHLARFVLDGRSAASDRAARVTVDEAVVVGPLGGQVREYPPAHRRLFFAGPPPRDPTARRQYAAAIVERVAERAFRRPVEPATLDRLLKVEEAAERQSGRFERGIGAALEAILTSPRFLFRVEEGGDPGEGSAVEPLDEHALAARVAALLLGSIPDEELTALARRGELRRELPAQVMRLLGDRKSDRFVSRFVGQWLRTRDLEAMPLGGALGKVLTPALRALMRRETEMMFAYLMRGDHDVMELVTARYTFLNEALARYYELPPIAGAEMRRVALADDSHRGGILTQGSFLAVTSNPTRTSPVKRGLYVLDSLLGAPPPPPPPNVPNLEEAGRDGARPHTIREQLALHRESSACAACHARMDPIGLALEGYDAVGRWREEDAGHPIDTSGTLPTGEAVDGAPALRAFLVGRREQVYRALTRKLLTFALGRGLVPADECTVDQLVEQMKAHGGRLSSLLLGIVQSPPFQLHRVAAGVAP